MNQETDLTVPPYIKINHDTETKQVELSIQDASQKTQKEMGVCHCQHRLPAFVGLARGKRKADRCVYTGRRGRTSTGTCGACPKGTRRCCGWWASGTGPRSTRGPHLEEYPGQQFVVPQARLLAPRRDGLARVGVTAQRAAADAGPPRGHPQGGHAPVRRARSGGGGGLSRTRARAYLSTTRPSSSRQKKIK